MFRTRKKEKKNTCRPIIYSCTSTVKYSVLRPKQNVSFSSKKGSKTLVQGDYKTIILQLGKYLLISYSRFRI